ncbi:MAG: UvrD-helicase domain-containing protein [Planctomycetota bacterium]|jgi:superfamily I DNA/RNA helicase
MTAPNFLKDINPDSIPKVFVAIGPPGTGKTTYLASVCNDAARKFGPTKVLLASLTKTAAAEIASRFAARSSSDGKFVTPIPKSQVGTLHAHAYAALGHPEIVENKHLASFNDFIAHVAKSAGTIAPPRQWHMTTTGHTKYNTDEPRAVGGSDKASSCKGNQLYQDLCLVRSKRIPQDMWIREDLKFFAKCWTEWKAINQVVDFEDLIDMAIHDTQYAPGRPHAFYFDESQDLSTSEFELVLHWAQDAGSIVVVGDPDQALYRWRGADPDAFLWLASEHPSRKGVPREQYRKVLAQSYRVPQAVHQYAVDWINATPGREPVEYLPTKEKGSVICKPDYDIESEDLVDWALREFENQSIMFLASCDYMMIPLVGFLRKKGIPFYNPFRTSRGDWNPLRAGGRILNYLRPDEKTWGADARSWTWEELWNWIELVDAEWLCRGAKTEIKNTASDELFQHKLVDQTITESIETVRNSFAVADLFKPCDVKQLRRLLKRTKEEKKISDITKLTREQRRLDYIFRLVDRFGGAKLREEPRVMVGTIHSVKGGEADVVIISPDLSPEGFRAWNHGSGPSSIDVRRMFYVAFTRAKDTLVLIGSKGGLCASLPPPARHL